MLSRIWSNKNGSEQYASVNVSADEHFNILQASKEEKKSVHRFIGFNAGSAIRTRHGFVGQNIASQWGRLLIHSMEKDDLEALIEIVKGSLVSLEEIVRGGDFGSPFTIGEYSFFIHYQFDSQFALLAYSERMATKDSDFLSENEWKKVDGLLRLITTYGDKKEESDDDAMRNQIKTKKLIPYTCKGESFPTLAIRLKAYASCLYLLSLGFGKKLVPGDFSKLKKPVDFENEKKYEGCGNYRGILLENSDGNNVVDVLIQNIQINGLEYKLFIKDLKGILSSSNENITKIKWINIKYKDLNFKKEYKSILILINKFIYLLKQELYAIEAFLKLKEKSSITNEEFPSVFQDRINFKSKIIVQIEDLSRLTSTINKRKEELDLYMIKIEEEYPRFDTNEFIDSLDPNDFYIGFDEIDSFINDSFFPPEVPRLANSSTTSHINSQSNTSDNSHRSIYSSPLKTLSVPNSAFNNSKMNSNSAHLTSRTVTSALTAFSSPLRPLSSARSNPLSIASPPVFSPYNTSQFSPAITSSPIPSFSLSSNQLNGLSFYSPPPLTNYTAPSTPESVKSVSTSSSFFSKNGLNTFQSRTPKKNLRLVENVLTYENDELKKDKVKAIISKNDKDGNYSEIERITSSIVKNPPRKSDKSYGNLLGIISTEENSLILYR